VRGRNTNALVENWDHRAEVHRRRFGNLRVVEIGECQFVREDASAVFGFQTRRKRLRKRDKGSENARG